MDINEMSRKDFESVPLRKGWSDSVTFDCLIILPGRAKHDSGYRIMDFVAVRSGKAVCRLSGCSDVVHIDGIGGYGKNWLEKYGTVPKLLPIRSWNIDCLPKSGLLRLWCSECELEAGAALSSFEVYAINRPPKEKRGSAGTAANTASTKAG